MRTLAARQLAAALLLALPPLAARPDQATCGNAAATVARMVADPTNGGDEAFFKLPTGPANVMLILDQSGSMNDLPQCPSGWSDSNDSASAPCRYDLADPTKPNGNTMVSVRGTCTPGTDGSVPSLAWMESVTPQVAYPDPGRSNSLLVDRPAWGTGCVGNGCLFDPLAYYFYDDWQAGATAASTSATRRAHDDPATGLPGGCYALQADGTPYRDLDNNLVDLGAGCRSCMATRGFYLYELYYVSRKNGGGSADRWNNASGSNPAPIRGHLLKGTFLNANPPKFVAARKVVKDVAWMNEAAPSKLDSVRMGLTILDTHIGGNTRARLVVPLGPDKTVFPPTQPGFRQARQSILSVINQDTATYTDSGGAVIVDGAAISAGFFDPTDDRTPLASALFNVGQYFSNVGLYSSTFGAAYQLAAFSEKSAGTINAPWVTADTSAGKQNTCSICWACQTNSVILITDGMPNTEITLPATVRSYDNAAYNQAANCGSQNIGGTNYTCGSSHLPRVASWLHNNDVRSDMTTGGRQAVTTHTVGFAINDNTALKVLRATANMGAGLFQRAETATQLADAVYNALNQAVLRENTFSAASAASLQTVQTAAAEAYLTRFRPSNTIAAWQGHVFQGGLFDEFLNGCDPSRGATDQPTVTCGGRSVRANFNEDEDPVTGLAVCTGLFLIDRECQEVAEDPNTGKFIQRATGNPAVFEWDAGAALSDATVPGYRSAVESGQSARNITTWIGGARVDFVSGQAAALRPYMNIDAAWCTAFLTRLGIPIPADPTLECTRQVIHFVRGWDVLDYDNDGCRGPGHPSNPGKGCASGDLGEQREWRNWTPGNPGAAAPTVRAEDNQFWKLGDIFHSSPAVVTAPIDEFRCATAFEKQCVATIFSPPDWKEQTPIATCTIGGIDLDAYECWRRSIRDRKRVVLVGGNDGMLHAFDAGEANVAAGLDPAGAYGYLAGDGEELWAFIPPDLLPKLRYMLDSHQYMVDGSVMVRDIWVDGGAAGTPAARNGRKEQNEFHTVAIFGERGGGTRFHALDVTDPTSAPRLLWSFPEPATEDDRLMGHTWADFAPKPPPIGPVRVASSSDSRGFEERWVVMLNGGFDPALVKGRAVFMLDAWSGQKVWRFTDADFKRQLGHAAGTSMFPVAAGLAMVVLGDTTPASREKNGFFDTATWGDLGGNVFVARFREPGSPSSGASNWFAARAFEQGRRDDDLQSATNRNEFFYMSANVYEPATQTLRTYLGSGNRERLMSQGPSCGTDNLMACCQSGCSQVTSTVTDDAGACNLTDAFSCANGLLQHGDPTTTAACGVTASCAAAPGGAYRASARVQWTCPGAGAIADQAATTSCDANGVCAVSTLGDRIIAGSFSDSQKNRFYGFWSYGGHAAKMFDSQATARTFDQNRFTDNPAYGGSCSGPRNNACRLVDVTQAAVSLSSSGSVGVTCGAGTTCKANLRDAGWFYQFGDVCQQASCNPAPPWKDEKTSANANVASGCSSWSGFRPYGMTTTTDPCSGSLGTPVSYTYLSDFITGTPRPSCGAVDEANDPGRIRRVGGAKSVTSPPQGATTRISFGPDGTIRYTMLEVDGSKARQVKVRDRQEAAEPIYWLEVDPTAHQCRHVSSAACP